jgi:putative ABC transport system permease protein
LPGVEGAVAAGIDGGHVGGMFRVALKMLIGNTGKYIMLIGGVAFATLLMCQQSGVFCGIMTWTNGTLRNVGASIWVSDPKVEQVNETIALRDTDLSRVRSVAGVAHAMPLYQGLYQARLANGSLKSVQIIGVDSTTFVGRPPVMVQGAFEDVRRPNTVVLDDLGAMRLSTKFDPVTREKIPMQVGDVFEINDKEARVVGICKAARSFQGMPYVFTTYERATQYTPPTRKKLSFVIVEPKPGVDAKALAGRITRETGLLARDKETFYWDTIWWYFRNTGIPISFGTTIVLGFVVGMAVAGQTFYTFILENLSHLGALKAMGAGTWLLVRMVLLQSFAAGIIGYGIGAGMAAVIGLSFLKKGMPPFYISWHVPAGAFVLVSLICAFAALLGIVKVARAEAAMVFRG